MGDLDQTFSIQPLGSFRSDSSIKGPFDHKDAFFVTPRGPREFYCMIKVC